MAQIKYRGLYVNESHNGQALFREINKFIDSQPNTADLNFRRVGSNQVCTHPMYTNMSFFFGLIDNESYALMNGLVIGGALRVEVTSQNADAIENVLKMLREGPLGRLKPEYITNVFDCSASFK